MFRGSRVTYVGSTPPVADSIIRYNNDDGQSTTCDDATVARIAPLIEQARLDDRGSIIRLLEEGEASCVYCILSTIESICRGCLQTVLHVWTDYDIDPRPCLPALASALASAQAREVRLALESAVPFGLSTAASAAATDLFVPTGERVHGAPVYRGIHRGEAIARCNSAEGRETLVISAIEDIDALGRCEGRLWIELSTAQIRTNVTDMGGVHFSLGLERCSDVLQTELSRLSVFQPDTDAKSPGNGGEIVLFNDGASELDISCTLLWKVGAHTPARQRHTIVRLPVAHSITLLGDIVVRQGESLTLGVASASLEGTLTGTLVVNGAQIRVESGGELELVGLEVTMSFGGSAICNKGRLVVLNSTFSRCSASTNSVQRHVPVPDRKGAYLSAAGGVIMSILGQLRSIGSTFEDNSARFAKFNNSGGAIFAQGGRVVLEMGSVFRRNRVEGGYANSGGAVAVYNADFLGSDSEFSGNEAHSSKAGAKYVGAGALFLQSSRAKIDRTLFQENMASSVGPDNRYVFAGALYAMADSTVAVENSSFRSNEVRDASESVFGGAIAIDSSNLTASSTIFESNLARGGKVRSIGGAIDNTQGNLTLGIGIVFRSNRVSGTNGANGFGGAICVEFSGMLTAEEAPQFVNNSVHAKDAQGGALFVKAEGRASLNGATFDSNYVLASSSSGYGGAVSVDSGEVNLTDCRLWGNKALMELNALDASGGSISIGAKATANLVACHLWSNNAGGAGYYESEAATALKDKSRSTRAAHIACFGTVKLKQCSLSSICQASGDALNLENSAPWWIVGSEAGRVVIVNSLLRGCAHTGGLPNGLLQLAGAAEALIRGCEATNVSIGRTTPDRLGIVNSTFDPKLSKLLTIQPPKCGVSVAGQPLMCDPRAACVAKQSGGVECQCTGDELVTKMGHAEDGSACFQQTTVEIRLSTHAIDISVPKPGFQKLVVHVQARGEVPLKEMYTVSMRRTGAANGEQAGIEASNHSWSSFDEARLSLDGHHIEWDELSRPSKNAVLELDASTQRFDVSREYSFIMRLNCSAGQPCVNDGDEVESTFALPAPMVLPSLRTMVVTTTVESLVSCEHTVVALEGVELDDGTMPASSRIGVGLLAIDVDRTPVSYTPARIELHWDGGRQIYVFTTKRGSNEYTASLPEDATKATGNYELAVVLFEGVLSNGTVVPRCDLLRRVIKIHDTDKQLIIAGVLAAVLLCGLGLGSVYIYRHPQHVRELIVSLITYEGVLMVEVRSHLL